MNPPSPEARVHPLDLDMILATVAYSAVGIVVFAGAFWLMTRIAPFSIRKEIEEDQNTALAVLMGSVLLGLAWIIAAAISGG